MQVVAAHADDLSLLSLYAAFSSKEDRVYVWYRKADQVANFAGDLGQTGQAISWMEIL